MSRKPVFWIVLFAASVVGIYFSAKYFSRAFPIVTIDLRMNREAALEKAAGLAARFQLPPAGYREVASFSGDQETQNFIELEAGGTTAFRNIMAQGLYHPFKWSVRHFKAGETSETSFLFTPRGEPYGFSVKLPEKEAGAALPTETARGIAEQSAVRDWQVELGPYRLVEKGQEVRPGGRIDHTFVYERHDVQIGEGRYRLRLVVGGDKLIEVGYFVKVPEAFSRRYEEMRSANNVISAAGTIAFVVLYVIGGCGVGLFFLLRQRWILWRTPMIWGCFIAFLQLLAGINQWPLIWMGYDTAIAAQGFVLQRVLMLFLSSFFFAILFTASFVAAESLSRRAFPDHPQLWSLWSREAAGSTQVLGRTMAGYLLVGVFFSYEVLLYFVTSRSLGWWSPSDILIQPDILAAYLPWLSPIAISAQAGFWEESLFRAVPLACAALLGKRYGRRGWWIAGAMVLQAVIFGSGHAGYANQPSYARLVELIIPSLMFGGLFLLYGLLPAIVLHYTFDVVWTSLPLFVSSAPGIGWHRTLVVIFMLVPLWMVIRGWLRARAWAELPDLLRNRAWQPPEAAAPVPIVSEAPSGTIRPVVLKLLPVAGILGFGLWIFATNFKSAAPSLGMPRGEAIALARQALAQRQIDLPPPWRPLASVETQPGEPDRFVWQTAGKDAYRAMMHEYLTPPHWRIRFVRFEGNVEDTAEEYNVAVSDARKAYRIRHVLPEGRAGSSISEQEARTLAQAQLKSEFGLDPAGLKEVSAIPSKLKARTDWSFIFTDPKPPVLPQGEKRISIQIAGDRVVDTYRFIFVPEDWERQQRDKETIPSIIRVVSTIAVVLIGLAGLSYAVFSWSRKRFTVSAFLALGGTILALSLANFLNQVPEASAQFSTAQPYKVQMFLMLGLGLVGFVILSGGMGLINGLLHPWCAGSLAFPKGAWWIAGIALGGAAAGIFALGSRFGPSLTPLWGDHSALGAWLPFLMSALGPPASYLLQATLTLLIFSAVHRMTGSWRTRKSLFGILLFAFGFVVTGMRGPDTVSSWLFSGAVTGVMLLASYLLVVRFSLRLVLVAVGVGQILAAVRHLVSNTSSGIIAGTGVGIILVGAATWLWSAFFSKGNPSDMPKC